MLFYLPLYCGNQGQTMSKARIGIVTVSDRASAGIYEDLSGKAIIDTLNAYLTSEWEPVYQVIPDEQDQIEATWFGWWTMSSAALSLPRGHRAGQAGCDPGGHRGGVRSHDAGLWRADAGRVPQVRADRHPVAPDRRPARQLAHRQPAGQAQIDPRVPGCGLPRHSYCIDLMEGPYLECDEAIIKPFRPKK
jgi:molybdopterin adenylyltransferase